MEMRMPTEKEVIILRLLSDDRETYAWDMVKISGNQLKENGVYVILMRMVARGLLSDRLDETPVRKAGPRRRLYRITDHGRKTLAAYEEFAKIVATNQKPPIVPFTLWQWWTWKRLNLVLA